MDLPDVSALGEYKYLKICPNVNKQLLYYPSTVVPSYEYKLPVDSLTLQVV